MPVNKGALTRVKQLRSVNEIDKYFNRIKKTHGDGGEINLIFDIDYYSGQVCGKILELSNLLVEKGYIPVVNIGNNNLEFTKEEMENFVSCEEYLKKQGHDFYIKDSKVLYTLDEALQAYKKMQAVIEDIKSHGGSPFEKFIEIYQFVTAHTYRENQQDKYASRNIISVINGNDIVCVGFSSMLKHMCKQVGIECKEVACKILNSDEEELDYHICNMVYLKDDKYKIDGYYHVDATGDAMKKEDDKHKNYNYCLTPISDMQKTKNKIVYFRESETVFNPSVTKLTYDFINNPPLIEKSMNWLGLKRDSKIQIDNRKYRKDRKPAINKLMYLLKEKDIPSDFYTVVKDTGNILQPYALMTLCFDYDKNKELVDYSIQSMKKLYSEAKEANHKTQKDDFRIEDIYKFLEETSNSDYSEIEHYQSAHILFFLNCIENIFNRSEQIRENSEPIPLDKFAKALRFSKITNGQSKECAENFAKKAIQHSVKRSISKFNEQAQNCFRYKAQEEYIKKLD